MLKKNKLDKMGESSLVCLESFPSFLLLPSQNAMTSQCALDNTNSRYV